MKRDSKHDNYPSVMAETDVDRLRELVINWTEAAAFFARNSDFHQSKRVEAEARAEILEAALRVVAATDRPLERVDGSKGTLPCKHCGVPHVFASERRRHWAAEDGHGYWPMTPAKFAQQTLTVDRPASEADA